MNRLSTNTLVYVGAVAAVGAGTALLIWLATSFSVIQAILGLMVVLILPGYALVELLMGRRTLDTLQQLFLVLIASLSFAILGGLLLNQLPVGLDLAGWLAVFVSITVGCTLFAWFLRHRRHETLILHRMPVRISQLFVMGLAVALASGALMLARTPASAENYAGYTMLWMTPVQGEDANHLQLGIDSKEFTPTQYKLELRVNEQIAQEWTMIELSSNQQWQANLAFNAEQLGTGSIEANLYRLDQPNEVYRHVVLHPQMGTTQK